MPRISGLTFALAMLAALGGCSDSTKPDNLQTDVHPLNDSELVSDGNRAADQNLQNCDDACQSEGESSGGG